jgi:release factor glutamine methyltransferase
MITLVKARQWAVRELVRGGSEEAEVEADWLLCDLTGLRRAELPLHRGQPLTPRQERALRAAVARRAQREPLAYILGTQEFLGLTFAVDRRTLVPRPETEVLVEQVLSRWHPHQTLLADVGTGCGTIAVSLAVSLPTVWVVATDVSEAALAVARANAQRHGVAGRVHLMAGSLLAPVRSVDTGGGVDVIVANLPYVPSADLDNLQPEVSLWEPRQALDGGPDGLALYRRLFAQIPALLRPGGFMASEFGLGQAAAMSELARCTPGLGAVEIITDYSGHERVLVARRET